MCGYRVRRRSIPDKRLMVTGGAGFIGSNFVRYMLERYPDYRVVVLDKLTYAGNLDNLKDVAERLPRYAFVQGDICDAAAVRRRRCSAHEIDTIVNFAAETHVDRSLMEPDAFIQTDVYGTYVLLEAARKLGVERYHQVSTDEVYGEVLAGASSRRPIPLQPRSPYSASKAGGDLLCLAYFTSFGAAGDHHPRLQQHRPLPVPGKGRAAVHHQRHRRPAAAALRRRPADARLPVCAGPLRGHRRGAAQGQPGEVYNLGTGVETDNIDMAHADPGAAGQAGQPDPARHRPPRPRPALCAGLRQDPGAGLASAPHLRAGHREDGALVRGQRMVVAQDQVGRAYMEYYQKHYAQRQVLDKP